MFVRNFPVRACVAVVLAYLLSCSPEPVRPRRALSLADGVTPAESVALGAHSNAVKRATKAVSGEVVCTLTWEAPGTISGCESSVPSVAPEVPWLQHSGEARDPGEIEQRLPIHIKFPAPVRTITLSSTGALKCTGTLGRIVGFRNNVQVGEADNTLIDPADCGDDDVTYGVQGSLPLDLDIDSLVIEGVDPWTFLVGGVCCGRALLKYTVNYEPGPSLVCDTVTRGQSTTCRVNSVVQAVTGWEFAGKLEPKVGAQADTVRVTSASTSMTWVGTAVLSGIVSAFVVWRGAADTVTAPLVVLNRSGADWSWGETKWKFHPDGPVLCGVLYGDYVMPGGTMLSANRRTSACGAPLGSGGSIEPNVVSYPDSGFSAASVQDGPNSRLWYVVAAHYGMDRTSEMNPFIRLNGRADTLAASGDVRACRAALGDMDPMVVNFYTYNTLCRGFSLEPMFDGLWRHEGFGTKDSLNPALANGHEARRRIAARDPLNDPYRMVERYVNTTYDNLKALVIDSVHRADTTIARSADGAHLFVKDNYVGSGNRCGQAWIFDTTATVRQYNKTQVGRAENGMFVCL